MRLKKPQKQHQISRERYRKTDKVIAVNGGCFGSFKSNIRKRLNTAGGRAGRRWRCKYIPPAELLHYYSV